MASLDLPPEPASATRARQFARAQLERTYPSAVVESVALLVTELVTNAVVHARTPLRVVVDPTEREVRVEVEDSSHREPSIRDHDAEEVSGRGLRLVDGLADSWGVDRTTTGKRVWCVVSVGADEDAASNR